MKTPCVDLKNVATVYVLKGSVKGHVTLGLGLCLVAQGRTVIAPLWFRTIFFSMDRRSIYNCMFNTAYFYGGFIRFSYNFTVHLNRLTFCFFLTFYFILTDLSILSIYLFTYFFWYLHHMTTCCSRRLISVYQSLSSLVSRQCRWTDKVGENHGPSSFINGHRETWWETESWYILSPLLMLRQLKNNH